jgi:hypothetical protein
MISLSNVEICASLAASAAALSRLTFCCGVSPGAPGMLCGEEPDLEPERGIFADACGVVEVNRVASVADRDIVARTSYFDNQERTTESRVAVLRFVIECSPRFS